MRRDQLLAITFILVLAGFLRAWHLNEAPPGLQHDEIYNAQNGELLAKQGDWRFFYEENQGREGAYIWLLGVAHLFLGSGIMMIRFPAIAAGLVTVALVYRVGRDLYNHRTGWIAAGLTAVSFWALSISRVGLRPVLLPPVILGVVWGLWQITHTNREQRLWRISIITGIVLGLAIYTYTSAFALYAAYGAYVLTLIVFDRTLLKRRAAEFVLITVLAGLLAAPMVVHRLNEENMVRVNNITRPWTEFKDGNPDELIDNAWSLLGMAAFTGDPEWRYNVADRPLFVIFPGIMVYVGFIVAAGQIRRRPLHVMLIVLALTGMIPSLLTTSAPSFLRSVAVMPPFMLLIAWSIDQVTKRLPYSAYAAWSLGIGAVFITAMVDFPAYFQEWANHDEVLAIYRDDLEQLAHYLNQTDETLALVSVDNTELDPLVYYTYAPKLTNIVFFDGRTNIVLDNDPTLLFISPLAPISPPHADWLTEANGTQSLGTLERQDGSTAFEIYRLAANGSASLEERITQMQDVPLYTGSVNPMPSTQVANWGTPQPYPINFNNQIQLVALDLPRQQIYATQDGVNIQLYLEPLEGRFNAPLNVYVHLLNTAGEVKAQRDLLGVRTNMWESGTVFIQDNYVIGGVLEPGTYLLTMGIYNWETFDRLPVLDANSHPIADQILISEIKVVSR